MDATTITTKANRVVRGDLILEAGATRMVAGVADIGGGKHGGVAITWEDASVDHYPALYPMVRVEG